MRQVKTEEQVADLFTKAPNTARFQKLREQLNMKQRKNFDESVLRGSIEKISEKISTPPRGNSRFLLNHYASYIPIKLAALKS